MDVPLLAWAWVGAATLVAFVLAVADKSSARRGRARVPEAALLCAALVGGTIGLVAAMLLARHKTRKASFLLGLVLVVVLQGALLWALLR